MASAEGEPSSTVGLGDVGIPDQLAMPQEEPRRTRGGNIAGGNDPVKGWLGEQGDKISGAYGEWSAANKEQGKDAQMQFLVSQARREMLTQDPNAMMRPEDILAWVAAKDPASAERLSRAWGLDPKNVDLAPVPTGALR